jgi:2-polyprenyl-3-methyl-5-hydroxy-6-metoxy-1,4-benzoquinol methylase
VSVAAKLKRGEAFDVAMGQGSNSLYLARQGANATGFELSDVRVERALERANSRTFWSMVAPAARPWESP